MTGIPRNNMHPNNYDADMTAKCIQPSYLRALSGHLPVQNAPSLLDLVRPAMYKKEQINTKWDEHG